MTTTELKKLEDSLWKASDSLRANSDLKSTEYATPVLGLIFLKFADNKYSLVEDRINLEYESLKGTRKERTIEEIAIKECGFYLPPKARYGYLLGLPESEDIAQALKTAMQLIEQYKPELQESLPQDDYFRLNRVQTPDKKQVIDNTMLKSLLKNFQDIPKTASGDIFGQISSISWGTLPWLRARAAASFLRRVR